MTSNKNPYGHCPQCGAKGKSRERRPNGNDECEQGHTYPSRDAVMKNKQASDDVFDPLPCPFCGSGDIEEVDASLGIHFMKCNNCKARGPHADWPTGAWNERTHK